MSKKNVTIALDSSEYKLLEKIKEGISTKSLTQTVVKLIEFYDVNSEKIESLQLEELTVNDQLKQIVEEITEIRDNMVQQKELGYLNTNIELIKQNYDIVQSLMKRIDNLQDNFVNTQNIEVINEKFDSQQKNMEMIENKTAFIEKILEKMFGIPMNKLVDAPTHVLEQLYAQSLEKK